MPYKPQRSYDRRDVDHLMNLVAMLPSPTGDKYWEPFWAKLEEAAQPSEYPDGGGFWRDYIGKAIEGVRSSEFDTQEFNEHLHTLVYTLLIMFDRNPDRQEKLYGALNTVILYRSGDYEAPGKRWIEDLCATAWRIEVGQLADYTLEKIADLYSSKRRDIDRLIPGESRLG